MDMRNKEGYIDLTAAEAVENADAEVVEVMSRIKSMMWVVNFIVEHCGFAIVGRVNLRDIKTGKVCR